MSTMRVYPAAVALIGATLLALARCDDPEVHMDAVRDIPVREFVVWGSTVFPCSLQLNGSVHVFPADKVLQRVMLENLNLSYLQYEKQCCGCVPSICQSYTRT